MAKKQEAQKVEPKATVAKSITKYLRISPRKVRLVINAIRNKPVYLAFGTLASLKNKAARMAEKTLKSAVGNAKVLGLDENRLFVYRTFADGGPTFKRFMSRSMGRADRIIKRTTHLSVYVKEGLKIHSKPGAEFDAKAAVTEKPKKKAKAAKAGK